MGGRRRRKDLGSRVRRGKRKKFRCGNLIAATVFSCRPCYDVAFRNGESNPGLKGENLLS